MPDQTGHAKAAKAEATKPAKPAKPVGSKPETPRARANSEKVEKRGGARSTTRRGNGRGWGGQAKGEGKAPQAKPFEGTPGPGRGKFSLAGEARKEQTYRRVETLMELLWEIANNANEQTPSRIQAAKHLLDRIQGLPVQTVLSATQDDLSMMTDDELAADVERRGRKIRAFRAAVMGSNVPEEPDGLGD